MAGLPDRGILGSLKGCSGWIRCMLSDTRCWWRGGRSGRVELPHVALPRSWGSASLSLLVEQINGEWNQPGAEQFDAGPSVHVPFERFETVHVSLGHCSSAR
jgi:hypothetical protein